MARFTSYDRDYKFFFKFLESTIPQVDNTGKSKKFNLCKKSFPIAQNYLKKQYFPQKWVKKQPDPKFLDFFGKALERITFTKIFIKIGLKMASPEPFFCFSPFQGQKSGFLPQRPLGSTDFQNISDLRPPWIYTPMVQIWSRNSKFDLTTLIPSSRSHSVKALSLTS